MTDHEIPARRFSVLTFVEPVSTIWPTRVDEPPQPEPDDEQSDEEESS